MNFNKLIDRIDTDNEAFITKVIGNYFMDEETNIVPFTNILKKVDVPNCKLKEVLYCDEEINYDDLKKFVSLAKLNGSDDWRIPSMKELCDIVYNMDELYGVRISIAWTADKANDGRIKCVKFSERSIYPSLWTTEILLERDNEYYRWFIVR